MSNLSSGKSLISLGMNDCKTVTSLYACMHNFKWMKKRGGKKLWDDKGA